ncbi:MAG: GLPGLI family protein [Tannerellaceae bacterium]|jgi:GLPGLI family protein|nr:GLPGLI family protein [Tannerellaceae bacterium]
MMTKKQKTVALLILLSAQGAYAQLAVTKGMMDRSQGKLKKEKLDEAMIRCWYTFTQHATNEGESIQVTDTFTLDVGTNYSLYYDYNRYVRDSLYSESGRGLRKSVRLIKIMDDERADRVDMEALKKEGGIYREVPPKGETAKLYKSKKKQEITIIDGDNVTMYKATEHIPPQAWTLSEDTATILGYTCQKAGTTFKGRTYAAWFAPEIPLPDGPWKLYGLPGLILKAEVDGGAFQFQAIGLTELPSLPITMDKDQYAKTTVEQIGKLPHKKTHKRSYFGNDGVMVRSFIDSKLLYQALELPENQN